MTIRLLWPRHEGTGIGAIACEFCATEIGLWPRHPCNHMKTFLHPLADGDACIRRPGEEAMRRPTQEVVAQQGQLRHGFIGGERTGAQMIQEQDIAHHFVEGFNRLAGIVEPHQVHRPIRADREVRDQDIVLQRRFALLRRFALSRVRKPAMPLHGALAV